MSVLLQFLDLTRRNPYLNAMQRVEPCLCMMTVFVVPLHTSTVEHVPMIFQPSRCKRADVFTKDITSHPLFVYLHHGLANLRHDLRSQ